MRVTKNIQEYITREVGKRLMPKYETDKAEAARQDKAKSDFLEGASKAAAEAYTAYFKEHFGEIADFCYDNRQDTFGDSGPALYNGRAVGITDWCYQNSVHKWRSRWNEETAAKVKEIVVTLELGGTKAELEAMLAEVGE